MRFRNKTALITGGASGIGAATALKFAQEGAQVIIADRDVRKASDVMEHIRALGSGGFVQEVDLAYPVEIDRCCAAVAGRVRALHALVNNAGIVKRTPLSQLTSDDWEPQMAINLRAAALMTRGLLPLLQHEGAAIVNVSSEGAFRALPNRLVYDITKAGMTVLTRTSAVELAPYGIRVNTIAPGWIVTEMHFATASDPQARKSELETRRDDLLGIMHRLGRPEEVANAIFFLASEEASYITGTTLHVDGGVTTL